MENRHPVLSHKEVNFGNFIFIDIHEHFSNELETISNVIFIIRVLSVTF